MLKSLTICNVLLIEQLEITFDRGFCALTGETGAGKSILLDALGLALGNRSSQNYIRQGADQAVVCAEFIPPASSDIFSLLKEYEIPYQEDTLLLRRVINQDARTRAFINDQPVSIKLLQDIGQRLIEIHGQFDQLLEATSHRDFLDHYAQIQPLKEQVSEKYHAWKKALDSLKQLQEDVLFAQHNEHFLRQSLKELEDLAIQADEEDLLTQERQRLARQAKYQQALEKAYDLLTGENGIDSKLYEAMRAIEKINDQEDTGLQDIQAALERSMQELNEAISLLESQKNTQEGAYASLEQVEERLFQLRAAARKHMCLICDLAGRREKIRHDLDLIETNHTRIKELEKQVMISRKAYKDLAQQLSEKRKEAAENLDKAVMQELPPLKLEQARFETKRTLLNERSWTEEGIDKIEFTITTNPGLPPGPLAAIASGGERSRFMLALKVVLARSGRIPSLVFDEIDNGVGGAVAYAIGERLARLATNVQVLAVTHSPQVAAMAQSHLRIEKHQDKSYTKTQIIPLDTQGRREEVARMLAGDIITDQARAAAEQLLRKKVS